MFTVLIFIEYQLIGTFELVDIPRIGDEIPHPSAVETLLEVTRCVRYLTADRYKDAHLYCSISGKPYDATI